MCCHDCRLSPILLITNTSGDFVAAIHAGWRGLNDDIIVKTTRKLPQFKPKEMLAFIGPAIDQECFEIGAEVRKTFCSMILIQHNF